MIISRLGRNFFFSMGTFVALLFPLLIFVHSIPLDSTSTSISLGFGISGIFLIILSIQIDKKLRKGVLST